MSLQFAGFIGPPPSFNRMDFGAIFDSEVTTQEKPRDHVAVPQPPCHGDDDDDAAATCCNHLSLPIMAANIRVVVAVADEQPCVGGGCIGNVDYLCRDSPSRRAGVPTARPQDQRQ